MYHIIVNPISGRGRATERLPFLTNLFAGHGIDCEVHITRGIMHGYEIAKKCVLSGADGIIASGGDGTSQEVAAGMVDAFNGEKVPVPLGIFPAGSGNDFVMSLLGSKKAALKRYTKNHLWSAENFFETIKAGKIRSVDVLTANGFAFLNIGNMGLDARIVDNAAALKVKYGRHAYIAAVYKSIIRHKNLPLKIEVNGEALNRSFTLAAICNGRYYGGGLHITPGAAIDDGKITLTLIEAMSRLKTMILFPSLMFGFHKKLKAVSFLECESLVITLPSNEKLCLDGNLYDRRSEDPADESRVEFKILHKALDVFV